jgi:transcriptional regulator with XRE-family HTH domain
MRRLALGLNQQELADRVGCDRQTINRLENARYSPSLDRWFQVADALGVPLVPPSLLLRRTGVGPGHQGPGPKGQYRSLLRVGASVVLGCAE